MHAVVAGFVAALVLFTAGTATTAALPACPSAHSACPPCPCVVAGPAAAYVVVPPPASADKTKADAAQHTEANAYTVASSIIWAIMWIVIALIAKAAISTIVEGARPKQY